MSRHLGSVCLASMTAGRGHLHAPYNLIVWQAKCYVFQLTSTYTSQM